MNKIEKIRAEIEHRIKANKTKHGFPAGTLCAVRIEAYEDLISFINSLSEEPDKSLEGAVEKLESPISRSHENGAETDHTAAAIAVLTKRADVCHDLINRHIETMTYRDVSFYAGELAGYEQAIDLLKSSTESIRIEL